MLLVNLDVRDLLRLLLGMLGVLLDRVLLVVLRGLLLLLLLLR